MRRTFFGERGRPGPAPARGVTSDEVLTEFRERLAPFAYAAQHPGSNSYFTPPPLPMSIAGETLSRWLNQGIDLWLAGMAGPFVEEEVVRWLCDLCGYGDDAWGVLTSGGVMANIMALTVARDVHLAKLRGDLPRGAALDGARVYASDQTHFSVERAVDLLGFPAGTLRIVASDDDFRLQAAPVAAAIAEDRAAGLTPFAICAVAGSTNTGSIDDVPALADLADREGLWLHVDAAYGAAARLSSREAHKLPGLDRADSLTVDPHKWLFQPYDIGGLLVRRREDLLRTFHREPEYYAVWGPEEQPLHWYQYSLEGTRPFRALKLWLSWKHLGSDGFAQLIERNVDLAQHLAARARTLGFEVIEPELAVVCLRLAPPGTGPFGDGRAATPAPTRPRGLGGRLGLDDDAPRPDLAPRRGDQLPRDARGRGPGPRHAGRGGLGRPRRLTGYGPQRAQLSFTRSPVRRRLRTAPPPAGRGRRRRSPRRSGSPAAATRWPAGRPPRATGAWPACAR